MTTTRVGATESLVGSDILQTLAPIVIKHPPGAFVLTPASLAGLLAIENSRERLRGTGIDWGCGAGCLAIAAAKLGSVDTVIGLDIVKENIEAARANARENGVSNKVRFFLSDSYGPYDGRERDELDNLKGAADFIVANPPSSRGDDGFGFRRIVLEGGKKYLKIGGIVLMNISSQYGGKRIRDLSAGNAAYRREGIAASLDPSPFDLNRDDLRECLDAYVAEERRSGGTYEFIDPSNGKAVMTAGEALKLYGETKTSPLTRWQVHLFTRI